MVEGKPSRWYLVCLAVFTLIGGILRFRNLDGPSLWVDELASLNSVMMPSWEAAMGTGQSHIGIGGWFNFHIISIIGNSDFAVRSTSAIGGTLLIPIVAEYGRRSHDEKAGIIASSMVAVSFFAVRYSQEFRPYMTSTPIIWLAFLLIVTPRKNIYLEILIIALLTFGYLSHYLSALAVILALLVYFVQETISWCREKLDRDENIISNAQLFLSSRAGRALMFGLSIATLSLFMAKQMFGDSSDLSHSTWIQGTPDDPHLVLLTEFFGYWWWGDSMDGVSEIMWSIILISPLVMFGHHLIFKEKNIELHAEWFLWVIALGYFSIILLYSEFVRPLFVIRYFSYSMPAWFLLFGITISRGIDIITKRDSNNSSTTTPFAIIIAMAFMLNGAHWLVVDYDYYNLDVKSDFEGMSEWLDENVESNDVFIISQPNAFHWQHYLDRMGSDLIIDDERWGTIPQTSIDKIETEKPEVIIRIRGHGVSNWNGTKFEESLNDTHILMQEISFTKGLIQVYTHPGVVL